MFFGGECVLAAASSSPGNASGPSGAPGSTRVDKHRGLQILRSENYVRGNLRVAIWTPGQAAGYEAVNLDNVFNGFRNLEFDSLGKRPGFVKRISGVLKSETWLEESEGTSISCLPSNVVQN